MTPCFCVWQPTFTAQKSLVVVCHLVKVLRARAYIASFVLQFYEGVGVLLHRKLIDIDLVDDLLHNSQKVIWEKVKGIMEEARKRYFPSERSTYPYFEYLYNEMQKREQRLQQTQQ